MSSNQLNINNSNIIKSKLITVDSDNDSDNEQITDTISDTVKFDLYNNPEYNIAYAEAEEFENSDIATIYKNQFCLKPCGEYKIREVTLHEHYKNIEPYIYNSFEEVKNHRNKHLCVLAKGHSGKCCDRPVILKKNKTTDKLIKSIDGCIYQTPGNDDYVYKNRASRLHPIHIPRSIEKQIRNKNKKLKCAIPNCEYSTPFMLATAYIDWLCYVINIEDIEELIVTSLSDPYFNFMSVLKNQHRAFLSDYFNQFKRKIFNKEYNTVCAITQEVVLTKHVSDPSRDNRIIIDDKDIQMGHIKSRSDNYFSVRGTNIVMMTREGNRIIGENSYIKDIWLNKLKNIIKHFA